MALEGLKSPKIKERHFWHQIPKKSELPTAEEIVAFLSVMAYYGEEPAITESLIPEQEL